MATLTKFYHDIDIFGRESKPGIALEYSNSEAISNALTLFLTSKKGEYLKNPFDGGVLDYSLFKNFNSGTLQKLAFILKTAINNYFSSLINLQEINLTPDYDNHILQYNIVYENLETLTTNNVTIYTNTSYQYQKFEYTNIEYIEQNLLKFIMLQKTGDPSQKLLYNSDDGIWYYGKFKLINLTQEDSFFDQILSVANT